MKRALVPILFAVTVIAFGYGMAGFVQSQPVVDAMVVAPVPPGEPDLFPIIQPKPVSVWEQEPTPVPEPEPEPVPSQPPIHWRQRGIGLPLVSDDAAAKEKRSVMLTFDDGPNPNGSTAQVLDVLKEHNIKAMFFITGLGLKNRDLVERIHREGHALGPHTVSHANLTMLSVPEMRIEIGPLVDLIYEVTGERPKYFRPPYGAYNKDVLAVVQEYGMELVNWTNGSMDWNHNEPAKVVEEVMKRLRRGDIILLHDTKRHTADALPNLILQVQAAGYEFVVMR